VSDEGMSWLWAAPILDDPQVRDLSNTVWSIRSPLAQEKHLAHAKVD
jgi:hypothetical protein